LAAHGQIDVMRTAERRERSSVGAAMAAVAVVAAIAGVAAALGVGLGGCGREPDGTGRPKAARTAAGAAAGEGSTPAGNALAPTVVHVSSADVDAAISTAVAGEPRPLLALLAAAPGRLLAAPDRLPPLAFEIQAETTVREAGTVVERLGENQTVTWDRERGFSARYHNSSDLGREVVVQGDTVWIRPGAGKFHRRPKSTADEPARLLGDSLGILVAQLEVCASALTVATADDVEVAGRPARRLTLSLGPARAAAAEVLPQRRWRGEVTVQALAGDVLVDRETGVLLAGRLAATVSFVKDGHTYALGLAAEHGAKAPDAGLQVVAPGDGESVVTPERSHELDEREALLRGIAAPAARAPAAASPAPAAPAAPTPTAPAPTPTAPAPTPTAPAPTSSPPASATPPQGKP
jgi:hypothetical protein